jgi:hypothetical protein
MLGICRYWSLAVMARIMSAPCKQRRSRSIHAVPASRMLLALYAVPASRMLLALHAVPTSRMLLASCSPGGNVMEFWAGFRRADVTSSDQK